MLTKMIGAGGPTDIAICGPDQIAEWQGFGYVPEAVLAAQAEEAHKAAEEAAKAGKGAKG